MLGHKGTEEIGPKKGLIHLVQTRFDSGLIQPIHDHVRGDS
jgi:hypothetical protein